MGGMVVDEGASFNWDFDTGWGSSDYEDFTDEELEDLAFFSSEEWAVEQEIEADHVLGLMGVLQPRYEDEET